MAASLDRTRLFLLLLLLVALVPLYPLKRLMEGPSADPLPQDLKRRSLHGGDMGRNEVWGGAGGEDTAVVVAEEGRRLGKVWKPVLTVFSVPHEMADLEEPTTIKMWTDKLNTLNAIGSWLQLEVDIILFTSARSCHFILEHLTQSTGGGGGAEGGGAGGDRGDGSAAGSEGKFVRVANSDRYLQWMRARRRPDGQQVATLFTCLPITCINEEFQTPTLDCVYLKAPQVARTRLVMFTNSDIVYKRDLLTTAHKLSGIGAELVGVGLRMDVHYPWRLDYSNPQWSERLDEIVVASGVLHEEKAMDYFMFLTEFPPRMPPFLIGRVRWDNWLVAWYTGSKSAVAIDVTAGIKAIHLNSAVRSESASRAGNDYNIGLVTTPEDVGNVRLMGFIRESDIFLSADGTFSRLEQSIETLLNQRTDKNHRVVIIPVAARTLSLALNCRCSLVASGVENYLFQALDAITYQELHARGFPVILHLTTGHENFLRKFDPKDPRFLLLSRHYEAASVIHLLYRAMRKKYSPLLVLPDVAFRADPFPLFSPLVSIQGMLTPDDKLCASFVYFRVSEKTQAVLERMASIHNRNLQTLLDIPADEFGDDPLPSLDLLLGPRLNSDLRSIARKAWGGFASQYIADGRAMFDSE